MTHFSPANERDHARANAGYDVVDRCRNCGLDFFEHENGACPGDGTLKFTLRERYLPDVRATEYRIGAVLLERLPGANNQGEHTIKVLRALRRYHPDLHDFNTATRVFTNRVRE